MHKPAFSRAEPDARRASLIAATKRVLAKGGAGAASVRAIAAEAGVSPGLIAHHFGGVDTLIVETYAAAGAEVRAALDAAVAGATTPRARLSAYVAASFVPPIADPALLVTWIAFWSLVTANPEIARLHDEIYAGYRRNLEMLLAACGVAAGRRRLAAIAVAALVDGLWLELCLSPGTFTPDEARGIAEAEIAALLI